MNTTILIIGIALVAAFIIPMVIINNHGKSEASKKRKLADNLAENNNLTISQFESFKHMTLALDNANRKLIYISNGNSSILDIANATSIKVEKIYQQNNQKLIESISLIVNTKGESTSILFYDHAQRNKLDLHEQNEKAGKWYQLVDTCKSGKVVELAEV